MPKESAFASIAQRWAVGTVAKMNWSDVCCNVAKGGNNLYAVKFQEVRFAVKYRKCPAHATKKNLQMLSKAFQKASKYRKNASAHTNLLYETVKKNLMRYCQSTTIPLITESAHLW